MLDMIFLIIRVIAVGGDGMFSEVLNGVLSRDGSTNVPSIKPAIKIGLIPAGEIKLILSKSL